MLQHSPWLYTHRKLQAIARNTTDNLLLEAALGAAGYCSVDMMQHGPAGCPPVCWHHSLDAFSQPCPVGELSPVQCAQGVTMPLYGRELLGQSAAAGAGVAALRCCCWCVGAAQLGPQAQRVSQSPGQHTGQRQ